MRSGAKTGLTNASHMWNRTAKSILTCQLAVAAVGLAAVVPVSGWIAQNAESKENASPPVREQLAREAGALRPMMQTDFARCMLDAVRALPAVEPRVVYFDPDVREAYREDRALEYDEAARDRWRRLELDERFYYTTRYGTPLAAARAYDLAAQHPFRRKNAPHIIDFGYGTIGHLRLLASCGAHITGIEVDPILRELYSFEGDTGSIPRVNAGDDEASAEPGSVRLVHGQWPADEAVRAQVDGPYDLFISKNTLKRGYIHPEREVDPRRLVHLGVDDETFLRRVKNSLSQGGLVMIYNIAPAPSGPDEPYKLWADGRCPFDRELLEKVGFEVLAYNRDDTEFVREMARALGWDAHMDIENDLFAQYTLLRYPIW